MTTPDAPLFDDTEQPVPRLILEEFCEKKQVSGLHYLREPGSLPKGWAGLLLEFTTSEALIIMAAPVLELKFQARLAFRWIPQERLWTRTMSEIYTKGHGRAVPTDFLQRNVQGEVIRGILADPAPTPEGGDEIVFEFVSGAKLRIRALPNEWRTTCADLDAQWIPGRARTVVGG